MKWGGILLIFHFFLKHFELITLFLGGGLFVYYLLDLQQTREAKAYKILKKSIVNKMNEPLTLHPEINSTLCSGCGVCSRVCPEGDVLQVINGIATLVSPTRCVGHGQCEVSCPMEAIKLVFGTKTKGMDIPRLSTNYETNVPGLYIAGELGGMGLIRNAIKQGQWAARHALKSINPTGGHFVDCELLIVGAGPAGLSACLYAQSKNIKYICIEQNIFGGSISNFPRQKMVMTQPAELPLAGEMKFSNARVTKEELLSYWNKLRQEHRLVILENCRFEGFEIMKNGFFQVRTQQRTLIANKIILAMGVHGSPRRLGLNNENLSNVTHNLSDPDEYQNKKIVVVGGGNAAVEAARALSRPENSNQVILVVRGSSLDRCNQENQNKILNMQDKGLIQILFNSSVVEIEQQHVIIQKKWPKDKHIDVQQKGRLKAEHETVKVAHDFLFILIGAEVPFNFLQSLGIKIDKKFGAGLGEVS